MKHPNPVPIVARRGRATAFLSLSSALVSFTLPASAADSFFGVEVLQYTPGTGAAAGYDRTAAVLGPPSQITPGEFGGPVDPFSAPWQSDQILSVGAGGSVTIQLAGAVLDLPGNPFGLDFQIFGASAFAIVNGDFTGGGVTDGSLFGQNSGLTQVSVSRDGLSYFLLDPALAPVVDGLFPTDGQGLASRAVNPALRSADLADRDLAGIRALYDGSAGGTGYDLAWARDPEGRPAGLEAIRFVRIDVLSGRSEIDAIAAIPEPSSTLLLVLGGAMVLARNPRRATSRPSLR